MQSRRTCPLVVLAVAAAFGTANADDLAITEPRNAATGFAIVNWMVNVDALGTHCLKLSGDTGQRSMDALASWQGRNVPYVNAALSYMSQIEEMIEATQGAAARQKFRDDRKQEFSSVTRDTQMVWFPDGAISKASCLKLAASLDSGELDLDKNSEFFPVLKEIKADMDKSTRTPAP